MKENKHQLTKQQSSIIKQVKKHKEQKDDNFLILELSTQRFIFSAEITASSKLLLIYLLSKIAYDLRHLYIHASYSIITKETTINKSTAIKSLKELNEKGFIKLLSGTERQINTEIKEFIFKQKQNVNGNHNQTNIVEMTPFFEKLFKVQK